MGNAFKPGDVVLCPDENEIFRVLFSNMLTTQVETLDGKDIVTGRTIMFEPFTLPAATV